MGNKINLFFTQNKPVFKMGITDLNNLTESNKQEVAFIGRSNVGKSSLINAITNSNIAITSKTPGRTKQLNFFQIGDRLTMVDMPGYGYAKVNKQEILNWEQLIYGYFSSRKNLKRIFLLIDARRGIKDNDEQLMNMLDTIGSLYQIILTKTDDVSSLELGKRQNEILSIVNKYTALFNKIIVTSSKRKIGIDKIREIIYNLK